MPFSPLDPVFDRPSSQMNVPRDECRRNGSSRALDPKYVRCLAEARTRRTRALVYFRITAGSQQVALLRIANPISSWRIGAAGMAAHGIYEKIDRCILQLKYIFITVSISSVHVRRSTTEGVCSRRSAALVLARCGGALRQPAGRLQAPRRAGTGARATPRDARAARRGAHSGRSRARRLRTPSRGAARERGPGARSGRGGGRAERSRWPPRASPVPTFFLCSSPSFASVTLASFSSSRRRPRKVRWRLVRTHRAELGVVGGLTVPPSSRASRSWRMSRPVGPTVARRKAAAAQGSGRTDLALTRGGVGHPRSRRDRAVGMGLRGVTVSGCGSWEAVKFAVGKGIGIAAISRLALDLEVEAGRSCPGRSALASPRTISVVTARDLPLTPPAGRFRQLRGSAATNGGVHSALRLVQLRAAVRDSREWTRAYLGGQRASSLFAGPSIGISSPRGSGKNRLDQQREEPIVPPEADH